MFHYFRRILPYPFREIRKLLEHRSNLINKELVDDIEPIVRLGSSIKKPNQHNQYTHA